MRFTTIEIDGKDLPKDTARLALTRIQTVLEDLEITEWIFQEDDRPMLYSIQEDGESWKSKTLLS